MSEIFHVLLFGDLTYDFKSGLNRLVSINDNALLKTFFEQVAFVLRAELGALSLLDREREGTVKFTTLAELLVKLRGSSPHPALEKALTCTHQFASFISHYSEAEQVYPSSSNTRIIGLCTGILTGVAVSCCQSLTDLVPLAVHTVKVAFRTGVCVSEVRDSLEPAGDSFSSWSALIPGLTGDVASPILEKFGEDKGLPTVSRPYISAYADTGITLSGSPSILDELLQSGRLPKSSSIMLGVRAPYHAAHLYESSDLDRILDSASEIPFGSHRKKISVTSSFSGRGLSGKTFGTLLQDALIEILLEPLRLNILSDGVAKDLKGAGISRCTILPVATIASQTVVTALKRAGLTDVTVDNCMNTSVYLSNDNDSSKGHFGHSKLAIVGYSGRFPDANSNDEFWTLLREGHDAARETPLTRWDVKTHVDSTGKRKNTSATPYGCWLKEPGLFDARFFGMSPREAPQVDPAQRLALLTAYEAMENAGMVPDATPSTQRDRVGVFYGTTSNDWGETNSSQDVDTYYIPGSCRAFIPGRQNYFFRFSGPSYSIDTACSSSLAAMHIACNALWRGDIDTAISGGTNVMTNPDITAGLDRGHFLSRTGNCKTFDNDADGYCRSEGVGTVIIKRLEDAIADNDPILATILGAYTNHSAEAESITRPHVGAQKAIFERVLTSANVEPSSVSYVEMHGTGTQAGDAREMESVLATFADHSTRGTRDETHKLYLGSAKANVGHGESVSGIFALIKVLLMLEKNEIPPHIGIKHKERNVHIAVEKTPWQRLEGQKRRAFINNFSAAGGNSSVLVEDAPVRDKTAKPDPRSAHVVAISAKSPTALTANIKSLLSFIKDKNSPLPSLSYTTTARRTHYKHRVIVSASYLSEIAIKLEKEIETAPEDRKVPKSMVPSVAFAFTGQGSQYLGMARELLHFNCFRRDLERFNSIAQKQGFPAIMSVVTQITGNISDFEPLVVQLATTCMQMAMARLWKSWGIEPCAVIGHSLGEYAALNVAGVLSDADTIYLTGKRAQLLQERCSRDTHSMLAVGASVVDIHKFLRGTQHEIACKNTPAETVLSGTNEEIDKVFDILTNSKFKKTRLKVPFAFHSSQVHTILHEFEDAAKGVSFKAPKIPVICPLLGEVVTTAGTFGPSYLSRHCREAVDFLTAVTVAKSKGLTANMIWVEIGPHPVVTGLLKSNLGSVIALPTIQRSKDTWKVLTNTLCALYLAGAEIRWGEYHRDFAASFTVLRLPSYNWDLKNYWIQYINDWSLYKGDAGFLKGIKGPELSTTCVQRLVDERTEGKMITVIVESDLLREDLDPMVRGHRVNGVALCTPSVYADIALTIGDYLRKQQTKWANCLVDVQHMDVQKPLVAKPKGLGPQYLRARAMLNSEGGKGAVEFYTVTPEGKKLTKHAECTITFPDSKEAALDVTNKAPAILHRMAQLRKNLESDGRVQKMHKSASYVLVSSLASYDDEFKGVEECILDSANLEAVSKVRFDRPGQNGTFHVNPHLIDNFGQPALFVMNANDTADLNREVFVNHGWTSLHFYKPVSMEKTYRSYVKMSGPDKDGMYSGDMIVFEDDEVVAAFKGVKAQGVPRRLMDYIVSMKDDKNGSQRSTAKQEPNQIPALETNRQGSRASDLSVTATEEDITELSSWAEALKIISEESGVPVSDLTGDTIFNDLGVDSLLALLCASRFREELGLDYESTIFLEYPTVKGLEIFWSKGSALNRTATCSGNDAILDSMFHDDEETPSDDTDAFELVSEASKPQSPKLSATSLLLQGNPASPIVTKTLFLLPDGSGSASSYASLTRLHPSIAIVGLNCPYVKIPEQYCAGIEEVATMYIHEIRRRQPHGPYAFGGWSVGGIFAYHVAQQLVAEGEIVSDLFLIDCPVPKGLDHLPKRYYEYCDQIGLLGEVNGVKKAPPQWLIPHFEACVNSLHTYHATPLVPAHKAPDTHIVWACDAIDRHCNAKFERRPNDAEGLKFLTEARSDFGPCGWETLVPESKIYVNRAIDANHFSMMRGDPVKRLSGFIEAALLLPK